MNTTPGQSVATRLTTQRHAVLQVVQARPVHLTAAEVYDALRRAEPPIAFATVYNALHYLVNAGLIAEVRRLDGVIAYDRDTSPHDHIICQQCGRLDDAPALPQAHLARQGYAALAERTGYQVLGHRVEYRGLCPDCAEMA
jgi:Fe2+ or Zn2+ uptake regulation protein